MVLKHSKATQLIIKDESKSELTYAWYLEWPTDAALLQCIVEFSSQKMVLEWPFPLLATEAAT